MLWGRAAGRCEFSGCNKALWKSSVTQEVVNQGEKAHIYAVSNDGPRGNKEVPSEIINDFSNLLLVCDGCHKLIDREKDGGRYTAELLRSMKEQHERRIEIVTGISPEKKSYLLHYSENIGKHHISIGYSETALALFPERYPAEQRAIDLSASKNPYEDAHADYWRGARYNLEKKYQMRVKERLENREINHLSVFAFAPQPLLILLGTLISDTLETNVFQPRMSQNGESRWQWPRSVSNPEPEFLIQEPENTSGKPVLLLSLSAEITTDRITSVLGSDVSIWNVSIPTPNRTFVESPQHLDSFRRSIGPVIDKIKAIHGQNTDLHVFPAAPISVNIELGRLRMPKAHMPWVIYDQNNSLGGFAPTLTIS